MNLGILTVDLHFPAPQSLKEKRSILKSLVTRIKNKFNVSVAEIDGMDLWQMSRLVIATVTRDRRRMDQVLRNTAEFIQRERVSLALHLRYLFYGVLHLRQLRFFFA